MKNKTKQKTKQNKKQNKNRLKFTDIYGKDLFESISEAQAEGIKYLNDNDLFDYFEYSKNENFHKLNN